MLYICIQIKKNCEMKLIAESGSTRTEWALVEDNHLVQRVFTEGLNPFFQTRREISRSVRLGLPESFFKKKLDQVYYYGAGCSSYEKKNIFHIHSFSVSSFTGFTFVFLKLNSSLRCIIFLLRTTQPLLMK